MTAIRPAMPSDLGAIRRIARAAFAPYEARIGRAPAPLVADYAAAMASGAVEVAEDARGVCGFVVLRLGRGALLETVAVAPRLRGQGIGRLLIAHAEAAARRAGFASIELYTHEAMTEARALYRRLGYGQTHRATEKGLRRVHFSKPLAPHPS